MPACHLRELERGSVVRLNLLPLAVHLSEVASVPLVQQLGPSRVGAPEDGAARDGPTPLGEVVQRQVAAVDVKDEVQRASAQAVRRRYG